MYNLINNISINDTKEKLIIVNNICNELINCYQQLDEIDLIHALNSLNNEYLTMISIIMEDKIIDTINSNASDNIKLDLIRQHYLKDFLSQKEYIKNCTLILKENKKTTKLVLK